MPPMRDHQHHEGHAPRLRAARRSCGAIFLQVGSLFSGVGLCDLGLSWAGMRHAFFCEVDPYCRSILARHWPGVPIYNDVTTLKGSEAPRIDILCGGFPCQDVSLGGNRAGIKEGTRSGLWREYARLIDEIRPKYAIIENVRGLLSCGIEIVMRDLAALGYDAEWEVLPAAALGAPHHRERVFIVAYPNGQRTDAASRLLAPLRRIMGDRQQSVRVSDWLGVRFDRSRRSSARKAYRGCVLRRVDDGAPGRLDSSGGVKPLPRDVVPVWIHRLKALGNGITPQQSYAVASCILEAEGLPVPAIPHIMRA